jgi:Flp pilus assembly protein TadG
VVDPMSRSVPRDEQGSVTIWVIGLCVILLFLGGVSLDLWRAMAERRALVSMADAAATAGASGVDAEAWRGGEGLRLDPEEATALATAILRSQPGIETVTVEEMVIVDDGVSMRVVLSRHVPFTLLRVISPGASGVTVRGAATASAEDLG